MRYALLSVAAAIALSTAIPAQAFPVSSAPAAFDASMIQQTATKKQKMMMKKKRSGGAMMNDDMSGRSGTTGSPTNRGSGTMMNNSNGM